MHCPHPSCPTRRSPSSQCNPRRPTIEENVHLHYKAVPCYLVTSIQIKYQHIATSIQSIIPMYHYIIPKHDTNTSLYQSKAIIPMHCHINPTHSLDFSRHHVSSSGMTGFQQHINITSFGRKLHVCSTYIICICRCMHSCLDACIYRTFMYVYRARTWRLSSLQWTDIELK